VLWIQDVGDRRSVRLGSHGEDMQLVQFSHASQKLSSERTETAMVEEVVVGQVKSIHILSNIIRGDRQQKKGDNIKTKMYMHRNTVIYKIIT